ncbi:MAG: SdrD B-like domain-containing protein, partial [Gammaproteobacteria bacterium]
GTVPGTGITMKDDLDEATAAPGYLVYDGTVPATLNGSTTPVTVTGNVINVDYASTNLAPGQTLTLRFRADINATLPIGTSLTNTGHVYWNTTQSAQASATISLGGTPGSAALNGKVWHDSNFNKTYDSGETQLANWTVQLYYQGNLLASTVSDSNGDYRFTGLAPNDTVPDRYKLVFLAPGAGANTAKLGYADSSSSNSTYTFRWPAPP